MIFILYSFLSTSLFFIAICIVNYIHFKRLSVAPRAGTSTTASAAAPETFL